jgi:hypothetical protein
VAAGLEAAFVCPAKAGSTVSREQAVRVKSAEPIRGIFMAFPFVPERFVLLAPTI